jgi:N-acetylglucosamine kinase-like BadF-type ATPase
VAAWGQLVGRAVTDVVVVIEGGGSGTRIGVVFDGRAQWTLAPTLDPSSSGTADVASELAGRVAQAVAGNRLIAVIAALSVAGDTDGAREVAAQLTGALDAFGVEPVDAVLVTNDVVPLLDWRSARASVVAVCGTGTGFMARDTLGRIRRAAGMEYILSDEGGGFDVGQAGLRAAVRGLDGRGSPTALTGAALDFGGGSLAALREYVYGPGPVGVKYRVAQFSDHVLRVAARGDAAALEIVRRSAAEIVLGINAVLGDIAPAAATLTLAGSMLFAGAGAVLATEVRRQLADGRLVFSAIDLVAGARAALVELAGSVVPGEGFLRHFAARCGPLPVALVPR